MHHVLRLAKSTLNVSGSMVALLRLGIGWVDTEVADVERLVSKSVASIFFWHAYLSPSTIISLLL